MTSKTLKNGATEIARLQIGDKIVVMGDRGEDSHECFQRYATWRMDEKGYTYWGHYFDTHNEAVQDLISR